jgi:MGT family glycosyltransferase
MIPLGCELLRRGHRVTVFNFLDAEAKTLASGLEFYPLDQDNSTTGKIAETLTQLGKLNGLAAFQYTIKLLADGADTVLKEAPTAIKNAGVEALLVDQVSPEGGSIAEFLNIPFITICSALVLNRNINIPPVITPWQYNPTWKGRLRNQLGYQLITQATKPIRRVIAEYRQNWNLPLHSNPNDAYSKLAQISQQPGEFEFPRTDLPPYFHFTGPYHNSASHQPVSFPFEQLNGKPLIYASMGTIQNRLLDIFQQIASACERLEAQLVISLGGSTTPETLPNLPGNPIIVGYAPQLELLQKSTLTITHAGMNTTLESLSNGVPMVAIPIANDQPGVAARIAYTKVGEMVPLKKLSVPKLRTAIIKVLTEDSYKKRAIALQEAIERCGGVKKAADIIEQVILTGKPVLATK